MTVDIHRAGPDDLEALVQLDFRNFGATVDEGDIEQVAGELDLDRFLLAWDGGRMVAAAGSYAMELTLPGGGTVPMSGVTWVSVAASHRRQGLASRLMTGLDELSAGFGEPLLGLTASEGGIYERFGYGISTETRVVEIDRHRADISPRWTPEPVDLVDGRDRIDDLVELWDRFRRTQVGEVSRSAALFEALTMERAKPAWAAVHPEGYAIYKVEPRWNDGRPAHQLDLIELVALTPEAHLALWNLILSVDLVGPIRSMRALALDDPLPHLLVDPRAVRTVALNDGLWLRVTDPVACFGARSYRGDDRLIVGVVDSVDDLAAGASPSMTMAVGSDGCRSADEAPDLMACRSALGPLLLGRSASELASARRLSGSPETLDRADALLGTGRRAHCATGF